MSDTVDVLDESCRASVWQYTDPIWPRYYAWFPDDGCAGWWHSGDARWFASVAGAGDVDTAVITSGMSPRGTHKFRRVGANPAMPTTSAPSPK